MKITYFTGLKGLEPKSMEICRKNLLKELKKIAPDLEYKEYAMKPIIDLNIPHFHIDRIFNRFVLYQFVSLRHYSEINHVLDHTYACALNFLPKKVKKIVTVHDLSPLKGMVSPFRSSSAPAIIKADKMIAVSKNTKRDLIELLKIPANKIKVIYDGVDHNLFRKNELASKSPSLQGKRMILNVANHERRKNTITIVKALHRLIHKFSDLILVRVGEENKETLSLIKKLKLQKRVFYFKNISEEQLVNLYNTADLFVYPSLYEGFGLPVLEAMACGCPVIASNTSSLPEVVGDAAIMIDPYDIHALTEAMERVLTNKNLRKKMIKRGLNQVKKFSWEKAARKTLTVYKELLR